MPVELDQLAGPDGGEKGRRLAEFWTKQIDKVKDDNKHRHWLKRGHTIEKRYRDERNRTDQEGQRHYNALWSNVEILTPAIYGKCPTPIAARRFKDRDPVGRGAAQILERALRNEIEICGFDEALQNAVRDYLLPGRGTVWVRYEPQIEEGISVVNEGGLEMKDAQGDIEPDSAETNPEVAHLEETGDRITRESTPVDYIHWEDFFTFPFNARTWKEVTAIAKRVYMTRQQLNRRFGKTIGQEVPLRRDGRTAIKDDSRNQDPDDKGIVYEIWSMVDKSVFWVAEGYEYLCDRKDDPLQLENFFPVPRPIYANPTTGTLVPVPDYIEYQDQAIQVDELTQRIAMLAKACKVAGVYNSAAKDIQRLLNESVENELIPVDDWAAFAESGGVEGNISFLPLKEVIGVLNELTMVKEKAIQEMDRLTGITDIMRGTTDARETFGGQRLKTNSAGTRLQRRQNEIARFARDTVRIMADIMSQHFSPISLIEASGALYEEGLGPDDMPTLSAMQQPPPQIAPPVPSPAGSMAQGPAPIASPPGAGAGPPPSNVVPFRPPGQPVPPPPGVSPPGMPAPAMAPQMPPGFVDKMQALQRIASSIQLIRNERIRGFRVDIEVDSTIYGDMNQDKADRTEFLMAVTQYLEKAFMMSTQVPEITPLLGKFLQFGVRGFHVGRDLETAIEEFCEEAIGVSKQRAMEAKSKPDPQQMKAEAAMLTAQTGAHKAQADVQNSAMKTQATVQTAQQKIMADQQKQQGEIERQHVENMGEAYNSQIDLQMRELDYKMELIELQMEKLRLEREDHKTKEQKVKSQAAAKTAKHRATKATKE